MVLIHPQASASCITLKLRRWQCPATAQRFVQSDLVMAMQQGDLGDALLGAEQGALGV